MNLRFVSGRLITWGSARSALGLLLLAFSLGGVCGCSDSDGKSSPSSSADDSDATGGDATDDEDAESDESNDAESEDGTQSPDPEAEIELPKLDGEAVELARELTSETDLSKAVETTHKVLARIGVSVVDPVTGELVSRADGEIDAAIIWPQQVLNLAAEARFERRLGSITLDELSLLLNDLDAVANSPADATEPEPYLLDIGRDPGDELVMLLAGWTSAALDDPQDPKNFAPLFLAAMAQAQEPPVDLTSGKANPEHVRLSLLDLEVLFTGLGLFRADPTLQGSSREDAGDAGAAAPEDDTAAEQDAGPAPTLDAGAEPASGEEGDPVVAVPASPFTRFLLTGPSPYKSVDCPTYENAVTGLTDGKVDAKAAKDWANTGVDLVKTAQEANRDGFKAPDPATLNDKLGKLVKLTTKLLRLVQFYRQAQIELQLDGDSPEHQHAPDEDTAYRTFTAKAGVSAEEYAQFKRSYSEVAQLLKSCASTFGIPTFPDLGDLLSEIPNWRVGFSVVEGNSSLAWFASDNQWDSHYDGLWKKVTLKSESEAEAQLKIQIGKEQTSGHKGKVIKRPYRVKASLDASQPVKLDTLFSGLSGFEAALGGAIDIGVEWTKNLIQPKSFATLDIEFHKPAGWYGTVTLRQKIVPYRRWRTGGGDECGGDGYSLTRVRQLMAERVYTVLGADDDGLPVGKFEEQCVSRVIQKASGEDVMCGELIEEFDPEDSRETHHMSRVVESDERALGGWFPTIIAIELPEGAPALPPEIAAASGVNTYSLSFPGLENCSEIEGTVIDWTQASPSPMSTEAMNLPVKAPGLSVQMQPITDPGHLFGEREERSTVDFGGIDDIPLITTYKWDLRR